MKRKIIPNQLGNNMNSVVKNFRLKIVSKKSIAIFFTVALITFLYFSVPISVYPDSMTYYNYINIFNGTNSIATWDVVRGPTLPLIIYLLVTFFGGAMFGILFGTYLFFMGLLTLVFAVINILIKSLKFNKLTEILMIVAFVGLIVLNPILFGYSHALLTEFVAIFFAFASCVLAWKWLDTDYHINKLKYIIYSALFVALFVFMWFLKQPYLTIALFPLLTACIISVVNKFKIWNIIQRFGVLVICVVCLLVSISGWKAFLVSNRADLKKVSTTDSSFLSSGILKGISNTYLEPDVNIVASKIIKDSYISAVDKKKIIGIITGKDNGSVKKVQVLNILSRNGYVMDKLVIYQNSETLTINEAISAWLNIAAKHPLTLIDSYVANYLAAIDLYDFNTLPVTGIMVPIKSFGLYGHENYAIGLMYTNYKSNISVWTSQDAVKASQLKDVANNPESTVRRILMRYGQVHCLIYMLMYLILPIVLIYAICSYRKHLMIKSRNVAMKRMYELSLIILGFTMLHMIFNISLGAMIDRYAYVTYSGVVLVYTILFFMHHRVRSLTDKLCKR